jgi:hypothetical protein
LAVAGRRVRIFVTREFGKFARRERLASRALCEAIDRAERGLIDADLGGGVIKQRVPRKGQGRSGGFRTLIAYRSAERSVFVFGFAKSELGNISDAQLATVKGAAQQALKADGKTVQSLLGNGQWTEIDCDA